MKFRRKNIKYILCVTAVLFTTTISASTSAGEKSSTRSISPEKYLATIIHDKLVASVLAREIKKQINRASRLLVDLKHQRREEIETSESPILSTLIKAENTERESLIKTLETFLKKYPNSRHAADIMLRLAELYYEKANIEYQRKVLEYQKKVERGELGENELPPIRDYSKSIDIYTKFIERFPFHKDIDIVLYLLGYCWSEMGNPEEGVKYFARIAEEMPYSKVFAESAFRAGEIYFNNNEMEKALKYYKLLEERPDNPFYDKALYKIAWTYYRMEDYDNAIKYFLKSIDYFEKHKTEESLLRESKEYLAITLAEKTSVEDAEKFLSRSMGSKFAREMILKMSDIYHERGEVEKALNILTYYLSKYPSSPRLPEIYDKIIQYWSQLNKIDKVITWKEKFIKQFLPSSYWYKSVKISDKRKKKLFEKVESTIIELANYYYAKASEIPQKSDEYYEKALYFYDLLINNLPQSKYIPEAYFLKGEIFFSREEYEKAAEMYRASAETNIPGIQNRFIQKASYNVIYSYDVMLSQNLSKRKKVKIINSYAKAALWYMQSFPFDPRTPKIIYRAGYMLMKNELYKEAIKYFEIIVNNYFTLPLVEDAIKNIIKIYVDQKDFASLYKKGFEYLSRPELLRPSIKDYLIEVVGGSLFKTAMQYLNNSKYDEAITLFKRVRKKFPDTDLAEKSLFNIAVSFEGKGDYSQAIKVLEEFIKIYPESELLKKALFKLASLYDRVFDFQNALKYYSMVYEKFPREKESKFSLYNSAKISHDMGNYDLAIRYYTEYLNRYPKDENASEFLLNLAECYEKIGQKEKAFEVYREFLRRYPKDLQNAVKIYAKLGDYFKEKGEWEKAKENYTKTLTLYFKLNKEGQLKLADVAARAHFTLLYHLYEKYYSIKLELPQKKMARLLEKKAKLLKKLTEDLMKIPAYGDAYWAEAALYLIARGYKDFAEALYNAPIPPGLTEEERDIYLQELQMQAFPIEEKALEAAKKAIEYAEKLGIENEWVYKSRLLLQKLKPGYELKRADEKIVPAVDRFFYVYRDTTPEKTTFSKLRVAAKEKKKLFIYLSSGRINKFFTRTSLNLLENYRKSYFITPPEVK